MNSDAFQVRTDIDAAIGEAVAANFSILFVHVSWAPMKLQRDLFLRFAADCQNKSPGVICFRYIDFTDVSDDYPQLFSLPGWAELRQQSGNAMIHGYGELVWMDHGNVVHVERTLNYKNESELTAKTNSLFTIDMSK
ncbi:MAG: hypothetical protein JWN70_701 [Planctomycetaceae bacterium]|nr:hypothetical protein [Planctomycetaceae bacterium]